MEPNEPTRTTRRDFARDLFLAGAAPLLVGTGEVTAADQPEKPPSDLESLLLLVQAQYGKHLTKEQLPLLTASLARGLASAERMKKVPLKNSDEPAVLFRSDLP